MRVLVSVANLDDARAALAGGADIVDAKAPSAGALGAVAPGVLAAIAGVVAGRRPLSAALGDAADASVAAAAIGAAAAGADYVKLAFAGHPAPPDLVALLTHVRRSLDRAGHEQCALVAAAYADRSGAGDGPAPPAVIDAAAAAGSDGVLVDTADKARGSLLDVADPVTIGGWIRHAHARGLWLALAGRLTSRDLPRLAALGADLVGVRGAVCTGGREGAVSADLVRQLMQKTGTAVPGALPARAGRHPARTTP